MRPKTPLLTVDAVIELAGDRIVLVKRRYEPLGWALPGGFVDPGESLYDAVVREVLEETSLEIIVIDLLHVYSKPWRDPRGDTVSVVYCCTADGVPAGGDDAAEAKGFLLSDLPDNLAFDHADIIADYIRWRKTGVKPSISS